MRATHLAIRYAKVAVESNSQISEFDSYGPLARDALNYCPRLPDVKTFRSAFALQWNRSHLDPDGGLTKRCDLADPEVDAAFAAFIDGIVIQRTGHNIEWHKLKPQRLRRK